ncbi:MAG: cytochrome C oxidase subunit IV [Chloroflexi bacterium]|nr:MAG: cytochrome C oxidase subunit IV [Chloroflexota bacterium]
MATLPEPVEEHHPGVREYATIAVILTVITAIEVALFYISAVEDFLAPMLLVLSLLKFVLVVGYYMHLKMDNRLFRYVFAAGFIIALSIVATLMALFDRW